MSSSDASAPGRPPTPHRAGSTSSTPTVSCNRHRGHHRQRVAAHARQRKDVRLQPGAAAWVGGGKGRARSGGDCGHDGSSKPEEVPETEVFGDEDLVRYRILLYSSVDRCIAMTENASPRPTCASSAGSSTTRPPALPRRRAIPPGTEVGGRAGQLGLPRVRRAQGRHFRLVERSELETLRSDSTMRILHTLAAASATASAPSISTPPCSA